MTVKEFKRLLFYNNSVSFIWNDTSYTVTKYQNYFSIIENKNTYIKCSCVHPVSSYYESMIEEFIHTKLFSNKTLEEIISEISKISKNNFA